MIRVWAYVPQDAAFGVKPGVEAVICVPAMLHLTFHGTVARIADALQPGVYCTVELKIRRQAPALIVPPRRSSSIRMACRWRSLKTASHLRQIAIIAAYGTEVEVYAGVANGDQVILQPLVNLADGHKVQIIPEPPQATP